MIRNHTLPIALCWLLTSMTGVAAPDAEQVRVVEAIRTMYAAATNNDLANFHTVAARDFYAFDGGKRFEGDSLMELIKTAHAAGKVYIWTVNDPEVHISGDSAWITYVNRGSVKDASGTKDVSWLESAVLHKESGEWRIQFFHSTRVP